MAEAMPKEVQAPDLGNPIGPGLSRVEGHLKISGTATYAYEFQGHDYDGPDPYYGFILASTIAKGRIASIDTRAAALAPGVRLVLTHENAPPQAPWGPLQAEDRFARAEPALSSDQVRYYGEPIAFVVADSFEQARAAAHAIIVRYAEEPAVTDFTAAIPHAQVLPKIDGGEASITRIGDVDKAFAQAPFVLDLHYQTPYQNHVQMEPHASLAVWDGPRLTLYCSSQVVDSHQAGVAATLQMSKTNVRIISRYIGGGFGGKLPYFSDQILTAIAARQLNHPVKVTFTRQQMFQLTTHRAQTAQRLRLTANPDGAIQAIAHEAWTQTARFDNYVENICQPTRGLYATPNLSTWHAVMKLDLPRSDSMRAPGDSVGSMAFESAIDELAERIGMDPVAIRLRNDTMIDPTRQMPFTSRRLAECIRLGAERFGWARRPATPGSVRDGDWMVGHGMASAFRGNVLRNAIAEVQLDADGKLAVRLAMTDIGTGSYTILTQIAAEAMGMAVADVRVVMGDTRFPPTDGSGGSWGAETSGSAVYRACESLRRTLADVVTNTDASPLLGAPLDSISFEGGRIVSGTFSESLAAVSRRISPDGVIARGSVSASETPKDRAEASFGAHFVEVGVNAITGEVRVRRMLGAFALGRILNEKTLRSQLLGGMIWGLGAALIEENAVDSRYGHFTNHDLANYHVAIQADVGQIEVVLLPEIDTQASPIGAKGGGELGICGSGAAVANAIFNATGIRVRDFPITPDKILPHLPELTFA